MIDELKKMIQRRLISDFEMSLGDISEEKILFYINQIVEGLPSKEKGLLSDKAIRHDIARELMDLITGLGPLKPLLDDPEVSEIMVNGPGKIYIERRGVMELAPQRFSADRDLINVIHKMTNPTHRRVDESNPYVDISLPDGSRVNIILPPLSLEGPVVTIRKFSRKINSIDDLLSRETLTKDMADFLIAAVKARLNIVFSGATGTGKTTTLNTLSHYIPSQERIITIEDTAELHLAQDNVVRLETRLANVEGKGAISIRELFINSLRMRPDRIILGEIRSNEVLDMLQAISSGHGGTMAIIHGGSPQDVLTRMEMMVALSNIGLPVEVIRKQIAATLNLIVHQDQLTDGARKITHIAEIRGLENGEVVLKDLFSFETDDFLENGKVAGTWRKGGIASLSLRKLNKVDPRITEQFFA